MNTWISRRRPFALAGSLALVLAGCAGGAPDLGGVLPFARNAPTQIEVAGGAVVIAGPSGYCVDRGASRLGGEEAFVLLASCASVTRDPKAQRPLSPGLLTASATTAGPAELTPEVMLDFFGTDAGRATLARDGNADSVRLRETLAEGDALFLLVEDASPGAVPGTEPVYWRGVTVINGQIITLAVMSFAELPLSHDSGLATLRSFHAAVRRASAGHGAPADAETRQSGLPGVLGRLLR